MTQRWVNRDPINEQGHWIAVVHGSVTGIRTQHMYSLLGNDSISRNDVDGRGTSAEVGKLVRGIGIGSAIALGVDCAIRLLACDKLAPDEHVYLTTPITSAMTFSPLNAAVLYMYCKGPFAIKLHIWSLPGGGCDNETVVFCLGDGTYGTPAKPGGA